MFEGTNVHLRVLVDQRDSLTLVEQTELVNAGHIGSADNLPDEGPREGETVE